MNHNTPLQVAFLLFASAWSVLALTYTLLAPRYLITGGENESTIKTNQKHRYAILALDAVTTVFWLAGWIALAKLIGGPTTCSRFCAAIQVSVAVAAFLWADVNTTLFIGLWQMRRLRMDQRKTNGSDAGGRSWFEMS